MDMQLRFEQAEEIRLVGYRGSTNRGFYIIPRLWSRLHKIKQRVKTRTDMHAVIGLDNYEVEGFTRDAAQPAFHYYAAVAVEEINMPDPAMDAFTLPANRYAVFSFLGKTQNPLTERMHYIYSEWLPQSGFRVDPPYDFTRYSEIGNAQGLSVIEIWVPVKSRDS